MERGIDVKLTNGNVKMFLNDQLIGIDAKEKKEFYVWNSKLFGRRKWMQLKGNRLSLYTKNLDMQAWKQ